MVHMFENATYGLADDLRFGLHAKHDVLQTPLGRKITEPVGRYKLPLLPRLPTASLSHQSAHGGGAEGSNEEVGERHHHVDSQRRVQEAQHVDQGSRLAQQPACRHTRRERQKRGRFAQCTRAQSSCVGMEWAARSAGLLVKRFARTAAQQWRRYYPCAFMQISRCNRRKPKAT